MRAAGTDTATPAPARVVLDACDGRERGGAVNLQRQPFFDADRLLVLDELIVHPAHVVRRPLGD